MQKPQYKFEDVTHLRRDRYGFVIEIVYRNRAWSKQLLRKRLAEEVKVQQAALRVILENQVGVQLNLFEGTSDEAAMDNKKYLMGFHPKHETIRLFAVKFVESGAWEDSNTIHTLAKALPRYAEQIWVRILRNLNIKYQAQTFSTPRKKRRRK